MVYGLNLSAFLTFVKLKHFKLCSFFTSLCTHSYSSSYSTHAALFLCHTHTNTQLTTLGCDMVLERLVIKSPTIPNNNQRQFHIIVGNTYKKGVTELCCNLFEIRVISRYKCLKHFQMAGTVMCDLKPLFILFMYLVRKKRKKRTKLLKHMQT